MIAENRNAEVDYSNGRLAGRLKPLIPLLTIAAFAALAVWLAFVLFHAMPQQTVAMAVYPEGTLNAELAKRYREILARDGVDLKLVPSAGAVESVARLRDPKSGISVALIPGGIHGAGLARISLSRYTVLPASLGLLPRSSCEKAQTASGSPHIDRARRQQFARTGPRYPRGKGNDRYEINHPIFFRAVGVCSKADSR